MPYKPVRNVYKNKKKNKQKTRKQVKPNRVHECII